MIWGRLVLRFCIRPLNGAASLLAIMDIRAHPISFSERLWKAASRSLQSICKDMNFVIRFGRIGCVGGNHGCEGDFGKEVCCAAER